MGFFSRAKKEIKTVVQKKFGGYFSQVIHIPPAMGTADYIRSYGQIGWLFACVFKISQNIADSEWKAYKGEKAIDKSFALDLLKHPSKHMSQYEMLTKISGYLDLTGKAFLYIAKDGIGRPREIWVISPLDMWIVPDKDDYIKGYIYRAGVEQIPLDIDEVIFFNFPDFLNPYGGIGPTQAAANALESDKYSAQWNRNFFYNNAEPQGILLLPDVNEDDYDRMKQEWNDKYRGVDNAKKTAIIRGDGKVDYKQLQISQKDMDFFNLRQMNRDEILGAFGIHKSILGLTDDVSRANAETAEYTFQKHVIKPRLKMIQDKLNNEFIQMFKEDGIELRFTDPVPENKDFIKSVLDTQVNKTLTVNEGREIMNKLLGLQLSPDPAGNVLYQDTKLQPLGTLPPAPPSPTDPPLEDSPPEVTPPEGDTQPPAKGKKKLDRSTRKKIERQIQKANSTRHADFIRMSEPLTKEFKRIVTDFFDAQLKGITGKIVDGSKDPVDLKHWNGELQKTVTPLYQKCFQTGGKVVVNEFKAIGNYIHKDTSVVFDYKDPGVQRKIQTKVNKIVGVNETTKQHVKDIIQEAYDSEEYNDGRTFTISDVTGMLGNVFDEQRAQTIAQTEVLSSLNQATNETYKQNSDLLDGKYWLATYDHTRPTHLAAASDYDEESAIPVDDMFNVGGFDCECPGDDSLPAEEVVNCKCTMAPKVNVD